MATQTKSVTNYPQIGGVDGQEDGAMVLPDIDSSLFVAPTYTGSALNTSHPGVGYLRVQINSTNYRIPLVTHA